MKHNKQSVDPPVRKTSDQWYKELYPTGDVVVLDPDGWDRKNYHYSWYEELITGLEFMGRICASTCWRRTRSDNKLEGKPSFVPINIPTKRRGICTTHSGVEIDLKNPDVSRVIIEDIAHALSHICRWNGIPEDFFSVAEHCVMVAERMPKGKRLAGLGHDFEESILGDHITPVKEIVPELYPLGDKIRNLLLEKFKIQYYPEDVEIADREQLEWERHNIINNTFYVGLSPKEARKLFIKKFHEYCQEENCNG